MALLLYQGPPRLDKECNGLPSILSYFKTVPVLISHLEAGEEEAETFAGIPTLLIEVMVTEIRTQKYIEARSYADIVKALRAFSSSWIFIFDVRNILIHHISMCMRGLP